MTRKINNETVDMYIIMYRLAVKNFIIMFMMYVFGIQYKLKVFVSIVY